MSNESEIKKTYALHYRHFSYKHGQVEDTTTYVQAYEQEDAVLLFETLMNGPDSHLYSAEELGAPENVRVFDVSKTAKALRERKQS